MAERIGRCTNYSGCKLAYRKEEIQVVTKEFRCPECGLPLEPLAPKKGVSVAFIASIGVAAVLLLSTGATVWTLASPQGRSVVLADPSPTITPAAIPTPSPIPESTPLPTPLPSATPAPTLEASATPSSPDIDTSEVEEVRQAALKRIDIIPNLSQAKKEKLYSAVERAHSMCRLFTISFEMRVTEVSSQDVAFIQKEVNQPRIKNLLDDPIFILVILGFADKQGADQPNQNLSRRRAQAVMEVLRDKAGVQNAMQVVPMGGTDLLDPRNLAKNRIVEVWGAFP
jgi:flagellar motor protein MotB